MDRFQALQIFVKVAQHQGFAAAARDLGLSAPAVTRSVAALEEQMGTRLFVRTTRSVRLTESGLRFLPAAERILLDLREAEAEAIGAHAIPSGLIRLSAPKLFGRFYIAPLLAQFLEDYPEVSAQALLLDRMINLMDEGVDVAIRIGPLADSSLTAIRVGEVRRVIVAAPSYLKSAGRPERPWDLHQHRIISPIAVDASKEWKLQERGQPLSLTIRPRLEINSNDAVIDLVRSGWGVSRLLSYQVAGAVSEGELDILLRDFEPEALPIHVVHQEGRFVSAKLRRFVDFVVENLRATPALAFEG